MSPESDRLRTDQLLRSLLQGNALIRRHALQTEWAAIPKGRKRALFWVNRADVERLVDDEVLVVTDKGVDLAERTRRRLLYGQADREVVRETEYFPDGGSRSLNRNVRTETVQRLARRLDHKGDPLLSPRQLAAAQRFTRDLVRSGEAHLGTSDPSAPKVDGTRRHDAAEDAALARIDAGRALQSARTALGPDLSRLLAAVCGANERLDAIERAESWSRGTGLAILRMALDRLTLHYATPAKTDRDPR